MIAVYAEFSDEMAKRQAAVILHRLSADGDAWEWLIHGFDEKGDHNPLVIKIELEGSQIDPLVFTIQELGARIGALQITASYKRIYARAA